MARATAPVGRRSEIPMPRIRPWWDDCTWTAFAASVEARAAAATTVRQVATPVQRSAARIPALAPSTPPDPRGDGPCAEYGESKGQLVELTTIERDRLRTEAAELINTMSTMRHERDKLHMELRDLNSQVPILSRERDELLAAVTPLRAELADLQMKDQELRQLESEIQALRYQKCSLDREILSELRRSTDKLRTSPRKYRFDDS
jgi:hypothetical protein